MRPSEPSSRPPDAGEAVDATRRTRLANERTYLAWWRTGLTALAVSIGTGRVVPALTRGPHWPYTVAGVGFALLGTVLIGYATYRQRQVERALARGDYARPDDRVVALLTLAGVALGLLVLGIVAFEG
ncbi:MAG: DUF202 domain-containing protein [Actinobacteria bacterium]|nr:DUF202 domain-containing protein [Actinomycetota bacterium]